MNAHRYRVRTGGLLLACLLVLIAAPPTRAATPDEVDVAVAKAVEWLYKQQNADGNWEEVPKRDLADKPSRTSGGQWGGRTAIATYALLAAGESPQKPEVKKAIDFLLAAEIEGTYAIGMRAQVWHLLPPTPTVRAAAIKDRARLQAGLKTTGEANGFYDYLLDGQKGGRSDHSCSNYGVLGLWAVAQVTQEVRRDVWERMDAAWKQSQQPDGGWAYQKSADDKHPVSLSMTTAGVATLFITQEYLGQGKPAECKGNVPAPEIDRGIKWIAQSFESQIQKGRSYYALYNVERVGVASGLKYFGKVDWYAEGAEYLVRKQSNNGNWGALPDTCFGIFFLTRGRAPVIVNKLEYSIAGKNDQGGVAGNWNQRPRDVANFSRWFSDRTERALNWQIVNLKVSPDDLHDAPILYVSGNQALNFTDGEESKLREYMEQGGLIVGNADCGATGKAFHESFTGLGTRLFPQYQFRKLPDDHAIYTSNPMFVAKGRWKQMPTVWVLGNGSRELMVLFSTDDPAKAWQMQAWAQFPHHFELMGNLVNYATDKGGKDGKEFQVKGKTYIVRPDPAAKTTHAVKVARLQNGTNWDPEPAGWRRVSAILRNQDGIDVTVEPVRLGNGKLAGYKLAHWTGTTAVTLTDAERKELADWLKAGGTLIVDAAGGSRAFADASFKELESTLEGALAVLPQTDSIYSPGGQKLEVAYRSFAFRALGGRGMFDGRVRGLSIGGRTAVYYSAEDLSTGLVGQMVDGIVGYDPKVATAMVRGLLLTASGKRGAVVADGAKPAAGKITPDKSSPEKSSPEKKPAENGKPPEKDSKPADKKTGEVRPGIASER